MNIQELTQQRFELLDAGFETSLEARIQDRGLSRGFQFTINKAVQRKTNPSYSRQKVTSTFENITQLYDSVAEAIEVAKHLPASADVEVTINTQAYRDDDGWKDIAKEDKSYLIHMDQYGEPLPESLTWDQTITEMLKRGWLYRDSYSLSGTESLKMRSLAFEAWDWHGFSSGSTVTLHAFVSEGQTVEEVAKKQAAVCMQTWNDFPDSVPRRNWRTGVIEADPFVTQLMHKYRK
jgi:hypothetical protein